MIVIIIIFIIVSTLLALATLAYVTVDVIIEKRNKNESKDEPLQEPQRYRQHRRY